MRKSIADKQTRLKQLSESIVCVPLIYIFLFLPPVMWKSKKSLSQQKSRTGMITHWFVSPCSANCCRCGLGINRDKANKCWATVFTLAFECFLHDSWVSMVWTSLHKIPESALDPSSDIKKKIHLIPMHNECIYCKYKNTDQKKNLME